MLGLLRPRDWTRCPVCGMTLRRAAPECLNCREWERQRYFKPTSPQKRDEYGRPVPSADGTSLAIVLCAGGNGRAAHMVMAHGINPQTGRCWACTPAPQPSPKPEEEAPVRRAPLLPDLRLGPKKPPHKALSPDEAEARRQDDERHAALMAHADRVRARLDAEEASRQRERSPVERWLLEELRVGGGEVDAGPTTARAAAVGFTENQLRKARENLCVVAVKRGWQGRWWWLAEDAFGRGADLPFTDSATGDPPSMARPDDSVHSPSRKADGEDA